ncbi:hypothetical protein SH528x_003196 [Novipirellula sp. SH528]|uniref:hypothetical protein n=1 Tax=Novipirellula sp. SH528 TaxID=3454466 RepID=UPI003F9FB8D3
MTDRNRHRVDIYHHLRDDVVVMLPYVDYRNGIVGFGDGAIVPRNDSTSIGEAILRMLDFCATADTTPLQAKRDVATERLHQGIELSHEEQFPSFDTRDNWGRIYERYPALLHNYRVLTRYFTTAEIDDANGSNSLTLRQLQVIRRGRERGIYKAGDGVEVQRAAGPAVLGGHVSERLDCWRPKRSFFDRLIA